MSDELKPCPFCGGSVRLEQTDPTMDHIHGRRDWWGVVCRNTENVGGSCAIQQRPSASKEAAINRWNTRAALAAAQPPAAPPTEAPTGWATHHEPPMLFPTREEAAAHCADDEQPIALAPIAAPQPVPATGAQPQK